MASKIKVSELFYSLQGEGFHVGTPSVFLRTFGCNFRCASFSLPKGETTTEVAAIIKQIDNYKTYNDLPLVTTGCDSYAAVYPEFKHLSPLVTVDVLANNIVDLLPNKTWNSEHLVITGGEPLLGWQKSFAELLSQENMQSLRDLTFETNGTQELTDSLKSYLLQWESNNRNVTFSVSPKLSCSGESLAVSIRPAVIASYQDVGKVYLKFVISSDDDIDEMLEAIDLYKAEGFTGHVYVMAAGGTPEVYFKNCTNVANLAVKYGFRYSPRLQVDLWNNQWGT